MKTILREVDIVALLIKDKSTREFAKFLGFLQATMNRMRGKHYNNLELLQ